MGQDPRQTVEEIEQTRQQLARKVDQLVDQAKVEAGQLGKKAAIAGAVLAVVVAVGWFAKRRVEN